MASAVLDASAVLAYIGGEEGGDALEDYRDAPLISAVNLAEVVSKLVDRGVPEDVTAAVIASLGLSVAPFDERQAYLSAALRPGTREYNLSLGDRACLALASLRGLPALTADRVWQKLRIPVEIRQIR